MKKIHFRYALGAFGTLQFPLHFNTQHPSSGHSSGVTGILIGDRLPGSNGAST
jgi:hypothetical protein